MIEFDDDAFELAYGDERVAVPFDQGRGYGGHELVVSPRARFAALFLYTGQSEEGYELFALRPELRHLGGLARMHGEGHPPIFSEDERWLAIGVALDPMLRGVESDGSCTWAELCVQDTTTLQIARCRLRMRPDVMRDEENSYVEALRVVDDGASFATPWGARVIVPFPLPAEMTLAP